MVVVAKWWTVPRQTDMIVPLSLAVIRKNEASQHTEEKVKSLKVVCPTYNWKHN